MNRLVGGLVSIAVKTFALFALLLSCAAAEQLYIKVTVTEGTLAVGTDVSIVSEGVTLVSTEADLDGVASFNLTNGSYFALLERYPYPLHVSLVEVAGKTNITLTMRQLVSYASAYGQITGPADFGNTTITAYKDGLIEKKIGPDKHGYYILSFLPEGSYELEFESPGFEKGAKPVFLQQAGFKEVNVKLEQEQQEPESVPEISSPSQAQQYSLIEVVLAKGTEPIAGQTITATAPSGTTTLQTDEQGKAHINAAEPGIYEFIYDNLTSSTEVLAAQQAEPEQVDEQEEKQEPVAIVQQPEQEKATDYSIITIFVMLAAILVALFVLVVGVNYFAGKKGHRKKHKKK